MSTVNFEEFLPYLTPYAMGVPEPVAITMLRHSAIEFCKSTHVLQQDLDAISLSAGTAEYDLDADSGTTAIHVLSLYYNDKPLPRTNQMTLGSRMTLDWQILDGEPSAFTQFREDHIVLMPKPDTDEAGALTGRIAVVPTRTTDTVDSILFDRHLDAIVKGALSMILSMPGQTYSDPQGALTYGSLFRVDIAKTRALVNGGGARSPLQVRMRRF
jgi:hypothetical protein